MSSEKKRSKPVYTARALNVRVPVYAFSARGKIGKRYCVAYRKVAGEPLKRETFSVRKKAEDRADEMAVAIANGQADVLELTTADRDSWLLCVRGAEKMGMRPHMAIEELSSIKAALGTIPPMEAVNFYLSGTTKKSKGAPTSAIIERLILRLRDERRDEKKYIKPLEKDLVRFAESFPDLALASEEQLRKYLAGLKSREGDPVGPRRRDNVRDALVSLFRFAREKEFLPLDQVTVAEKINRISNGGDVTTYSPAELVHLLEHCPDKWLPWLAIGSFAGLRTSEIFRLTWSDVKFDQKVIAVRRSIARKIRISRIVPISENLLDWLRPWRTAVGHLYPHKSWRALEDQHSRFLAKLRKATGLVTPTNACRHSFGSHRLALLQSFDKVAVEMGNSPAKVREDYNDPKSEEEGKTYFGIFRLGPKNVISLPLEFHDPRAAV